MKVVQSAHHSQFGGWQLWQPSELLISLRVFVCFQRPPRFRGDLGFYQLRSGSFPLLAGKRGARRNGERVGPLLSCTAAPPASQALYATGCQKELKWLRIWPWLIRLPNFTLEMCSLDFLRQAWVAHCRYPSLTWLSRFLIPSRTLTIIANTGRVFFSEKDIHHDGTEPPSPVQELLQLPMGRGSQQVFLKRLYPLEDRKENIPFEHLVTHIKGNNSFNLHLHRAGIRCGPVTLSSAWKGRSASTFKPWRRQRENAARQIIYHPAKAFSIFKRTGQFYIISGASLQQISLDICSSSLAGQPKIAGWSQPAAPVCWGPHSAFWSWSSRREKGKWPILWAQADCGWLCRRGQLRHHLGEKNMAFQVTWRC